jgi:hypothetical protein
MLTRIYELIASQPVVVVLGVLALGGTFLWGCLFILLQFLLAYRKLTNVERLQMIDAGQSNELLKAFDSQSRKSRFPSVALGLCVPCAALGGATLVSIWTENQFGIALVAWICAVIACLASSICATIIMVRQYDAL